MRVDHQENGCQLQAKTVVITGDISDSVMETLTSIWACDVLVPYILTLEQEAKEKEKSA